MAASDGLTPQSVLAGLPGWQHSDISRLQGGLNNRSWLVDNGCQRAVLKIDSDSRGAELNPRRVEASIIGRVSRHGLTGDVLHVSDRCLLVEFVDGPVWSAPDFIRPAALASLARALERLHALHGTGPRYDAVGAARRYVDKVPHEHRDYAQYCLAIVSCWPQPNRLRLCHNDLVADNIIGVETVRFIDWEYAGVNDPLFDLATIVEHHALTEASASYLLDAYFGGNGARCRSQVRDYQRCYAALHWLWLAARGGTATALQLLAKRVDGA